jgi:hypothetical protein
MEEPLLWIAAAGQSDEGEDDGQKFREDVCGVRVSAEREPQCEVAPQLR